MIVQGITRLLLLFVGLIFCVPILSCGSQQLSELTPEEHVELDPENEPRQIELDERTTETQETQEVTTVFRPNLPPVPDFGTPHYRVQYDDGTWSVYGLRKNLDRNIEQEIEVVGYVVKIYRPPSCKAGVSCLSPTKPHLWFGDDSNETVKRRLIRLVGYAESQADIDRAIKRALAGHDPQAEAKAAGRPPIVYNWQEGRRYLIKALFSRSSRNGFADSEGLLEYRDHYCIDCSDGR